MFAQYSFKKIKSSVIGRISLLLTIPGILIFGFIGFYKFNPSLHSVYFVEINDQEISVSDRNYFLFKNNLNPAIAKYSDFFTIYSEHYEQNLFDVDGSRVYITNLKDPAKDYPSCKIETNRYSDYSPIFFKIRSINTDKKITISKDELINLDKNNYLESQYLKSGNLEQFLHNDYYHNYRDYPQKIQYDQDHACYKLMGFNELEYVYVDNKSVQLANDIKDRLEKLDFETPIFNYIVKLSTFLIFACIGGLIPLLLIPIYKTILNLYCLTKKIFIWIKEG